MNYSARFLRFSMPLVLLAAALAIAPVSPVSAGAAHRFVATTGIDTGNTCLDYLAPCRTLGYALTQSVDGDLISMAAGTYTETVIIAIDVAINGAGMNLTILDGSKAATVVQVALGQTVSISQLTIRNGSSAGSGGGIGNSGTLSLSQVQLIGNTGSSGGGIASTGPLTIVDSLISGNTASVGAGGAIFINSTDTAALTNVTISYNQAPTGTGGIHLQNTGTLNLTNVTIEQNTGGTAAALIVGTGATAVIYNSTIDLNTGTASWSAVSGYGTLSFKNSIVSANSPDNCFHGSGSSWTSLGYNLDSANTCGFASGGDLPNTDPELSVMGNYGGFVPTLLPLAGSPVIDAGSNVGCPGTDARGIVRPLDGNNDTAAACDIGATELKYQATSMSIGALPTPSRVGQNVDVEVIVTGALNTPTGTVQIDAGDDTCSIPLVSGSGSCTVVYAKPGPRSIFAHYTGDASHDASQQAQLHLVYPVTADFDASSTSDLSLFRPSTGVWYIKNQFNTTWGTSGDVPVPADYNGDGHVEVAVWRPSTGIFYIKGVANSAWGQAGDVPVPGDYDGHGNADVALWRPSDGKWYVKGHFTSTWGQAGDIPVPGDYNGDGITELGVFRPSNGVWYGKGLGNATWGISGDIPVPADYNGDGRTDVAIYRPSTGIWYVKGLFNSAWGNATDIPVPGDFNGDGNADIAVWRPSDGKWYVKAISTTTWGTSGDFPLVAPDTNGDGDPYQ